MVLAARVLLIEALALDPLGSGKPPVGKSRPHLSVQLPSHGKDSCAI